MNNLNFTGYVSMSQTLCHGGVKGAKDNTKINECGCVLIKLYLYKT